MQKQPVSKFRRFIVQYFFLAVLANNGDPFGLEKYIDIFIFFMKFQASELLLAFVITINYRERCVEILLLIRNQVDNWVRVLKGPHQDLRKQEYGVCQNGFVFTYEHHLLLQHHKSQHIQKDIQGKEGYDGVRPIAGKIVLAVLSVQFEINFAVRPQIKVYQLIQLNLFLIAFSFDFLEHRANHLAMKDAIYDLKILTILFVFDVSFDFGRVEERLYEFLEKIEEGVVRKNSIGTMAHSYSQIFDPAYYWQLEFHSSLALLLHQFILNLFQGRTCALQNSKILQNDADCVHPSLRIDQIDDLVKLTLSFQGWLKGLFLKGGGLECEYKTFKFLFGDIDDIHTFVEGFLARVVLYMSS